LLVFLLVVYQENQEGVAGLQSLMEGEGLEAILVLPRNNERGDIAVALELQELDVGGKSQIAQRVFDLTQLCNCDTLRNDLIFPIHASRSETS
jgi:hypothetical protein